jgi:hypothetical protein
MKKAVVSMKFKRGAGNTPRRIVTVAETAIVIVVRADGMTTLVPSSTGSLKNIKTMTRM